MGQKKALNGSHLEVFLAPQHNTEHDFDLSISNVFLTFVQLLQEIKKKTNVSFTVLRLLCVKILLRRISIGRVTNMIKLLNCYHLTTWKVQYQYKK